MSKRKIVALALFIFIGMFMFTFAGTGDGLNAIDEQLEDYSVVFRNYDNTILQEITVEEGQDADYTGEEPTREQDAFCDYEFSGWSGDLVNIQEETDLVAQFICNTRDYTVTFLDFNQVTLGTDTVDAGDTAVYPGGTPTRLNFVFTGWSGALTNVLTDYSVTALYAPDNNNNGVVDEDESGAPEITLSENNVYSMVVYDEVPTFSATATDEHDGDVAVSFDTSAINPDVPGIYEVVATASDSLGNTATLTFNFEVTKRNITVQINNKTSQFSDVLETLDYVVTAGTEVVGHEAGITLSTAASRTAIVGDYEITGVHSNEYYNVTFVKGNYEITQKNVEEMTEEEIFDTFGITLTDKTVTYNGNKRKLTVSGNDENFNVLYTNNKRTNKGINNVTAEVITSGNYVGSFMLYADLEVLAREITVRITDQSSVFGSALVDYQDYTVTRGSEVVPAGITINKEAGTNAGKYALTLEYTNDNYNITVKGGTYTITPKNVEEMTEEEIFDAFGLSFPSKEKTYNGNQRNVKIEGNDEGFKVTYTDNKRTDVGISNAVAVVKTSGNYTGNITFTTTLEIKPAQVEIIWNNMGPFTYTPGTEQEPTASIVLVDGTNFDLTILEKDGKTPINAGDYTAVAAEVPNYEFTNSNELGYTINAKQITREDVGEFTFADKTEIFDGTEHKVEVTGLNAGFTASYNDNTRTNVGEQTVVATITGNANYTGSITDEAVLKVTEKSVTLVWSTDEFTFNGTKQVPTAKFVDVNGQEVDVTVTVEGNAASINAGDYTALATSVENYTFTNASHDYVINAKQITREDVGEFTFADKTEIFDGTEHKVEVTGLNAGFTASYNDNTRTNVGEQTVVATITGNANYTGSITDEAVLKVTEKSVTLVWSTDEFTFNGTKQVPTAKFVDVNGQEVDVTVTVEGNAASINAGDYTALATSVENYTFTNASHDYVINAKQITREDVGNFTFADKTEIFDGTEHKVEVTGLNAGFTASYNDNTRTNVGEQTVVATITGNANYTGSITDEAVLKVTEKSVTLVWSTDEFTFNGTKQVPTAKFVDVNGQEVDVTVTVEGNAASINAGDYTALATSVENYTFTNASHDYVINAKQITREDVGNFTFADKTEIFDGTEHKVEVTGLNAGFTVSYNDNTRIEFGSQTVVATITGNSNYTGSITDEAILSVTKAVANISWDNVGPFTFNGTKQIPTATSDIPGLIVIVTPSPEGSVNAGNYTATASITNTNYVLNNETLNYTINSKTLTKDDLNITFDGNSFVYNGTNHSIEASGVPAGFEVSYDDNTLDVVGSQLVTATVKPLATNTNYTGSVDYTATLQVTPAQVEIVWDNVGPFTFNGTKQMPTASIELVDGTSFDLTVTEKDGKASIDAGSYTAVAAEVANYEFTNSNEKAYTINAIEVPVVWTNKLLTYNGTAQYPTATITINGSVIVVYVKETNDLASIEAGDYNATASYDLDNYTLTNATTAYEIEKATLSSSDITATYNDLTVPFTGKEHSLLLTGTLGSDYTVVYSNNTRSSIGTSNATATITHVDTDNYTGSIVLTADLTVRNVNMLITTSAPSKTNFEPGEEVIYTVSFDEKAYDLQTGYGVEIELPAGLSCPTGYTCLNGKFTWNPTSTTDTLVFTSTIQGSVLAGSDLVVNARVNNEVVGTSTTDVERTVEINVNNINTTSLEVVLMLDVSGSMWYETYEGSGVTRISELVKVTKDFVRNLNGKNTSGSTINLTIFTFGTGDGTTGSVVKEISKKLSDTTLNSFVTEIDTFDDNEGGGTPMYTTISQVTTLLNASNAAGKYAIVLGDGAPTDYATCSGILWWYECNPNTAARNKVISDLKNATKNIYTIGFSVDNSTKSILTSISGTSRYYDASNAATLTKAFDAISANISIKNPQTSSGTATTETVIKDVDTVTISYKKGTDTITEVITNFTNNTYGVTRSGSEADGYTFAWDINKDMYVGCSEFKLNIKTN